MESGLRNHFINFLKEYQLVDPSDKVLLAVSGGVDSVVMTDLFKTNSCSLAIAHMNFQLRSKESEGDEVFVQKLANEYQLPFFVRKVDTKTYAKIHHLTTQVAARELRYAFFSELCQQHGFTKIAIAHHADDQLETFFINLQRRSGLKGLSGIPLEREKIIRPLLFASRQQIEAYAEENKLSFRKDSSNDCDVYLRNRIRHHLLPMAEEILPGLSDALPVTMKHLHDTHEMIRQIIDEKRNLLFRQIGEEVRLYTESLRLLTPLQTWLHYLLEKFEFNREVIQSSAQAILDQDSGKIFIAEKYRMVVDRAELIISPQVQQKTPKEVYISVDCTFVETPVKLSLNVFKKESEMNLKVAAGTALFDFGQLTFPLLLRPWRYGDRFSPFGMKGSKLISDFLIDAKVSLADKEKTFVLISGNEIIWLVGWRASRHAVINSGTKRVLQLQMV